MCSEALIKFNPVFFLAASSRFVTLANKDVSLAGRTKLDRERLKSCMREMVGFVFFKKRREEAESVKLGCD